MKETQAGALICGYTDRAAAHIGHCQVQRLENETGEAVLTRYQVFPGIELIYNDVHLGRYDAQKGTFTPKEGVQSPSRVMPAMEST